MAILDQFGRPFRNSGPGGSVYRSASRDSQSAWDANRLDDSDGLLPSWDWQTILSGSRGIYANFGPARAACFQKATAAVGAAYLPDYTGADDAGKAWARGAREWLIDNYYGVSDVRGGLFHFRANLRLDSIAMDRDGDFFFLLTSHPQSGLPATQHIAANRCETGPHDVDGEPVKKGPYTGARICNGVIKNDQGRAIAYRIRTGDGFEPRDYEDITARSLRHGYSPEWHDQSRGIPAGAHALRMLRQSLKSHEWEHVALMMLSSIGLIERNPLGSADLEDPTNSIGSSSTAPTGEPDLVQRQFQGGLIQYFSSADPNSGLESISGNRPDEQWERFQDRTIRLYATGADWPYQLLWKLDELNGVTIRNVQQHANAAAKARQSLLDRIALSQVTYALGAAVRLRRLPPPPDISDLRRWRFRHPPQISIDPGRDTSAEIAAIQAGHTSLKSVVERNGSTLSEHFADIIEAELLEAEMRAHAGLPPRPAPGGAPPDPADPTSTNTPSTP